MKPPRRRRLAAVGPGDAVVEQPAAGLELAVQEAEVPRQPGLADVLGQPDGADRVEPGLRHVPVVEVADFGELRQAGLGDGLARPFGLLRGQGHTEGPHAVLPGRVHDHAAPAAAHVQQPHALAQPELARDQVELVRLRLFQRGVLARVAGARVGHRRPEHPLVEPVRHVIVVRDRAGVAVLGVQPAAQPPAVHPHFLRRRLDPRPQHLRPSERTEQSEPFGKIE